VAPDCSTRGQRPGVAAQLGRRSEAADVADLRGDGVGVDPAQTRCGDQQRDVAVIGALALELHGQLGDLQLEIVDELQADIDGAPPRVGDLKAVKQLAAGVPEQVETGHGWPKVISVAWMRFFSVVR
jgi:hypothetical protein